jgi:hypothetical protein
MDTDTMATTVTLGIATDTETRPVHGQLRAPATAYSYPALSDAFAIAGNQESVQQFTAMTLSHLMLGEFLPLNEEV